MGKAIKNCTAMRTEYEFSGGVRGKYTRNHPEGTKIVLLDRDVRDVFRDSRSVNQSLRAIAKLVRSHSQ